MKRLIWILVPVIVIGALITWRMNLKHQDQVDQAQSAMKRRKAAPVVTLAPVLRHDVVNAFAATGSLEAPQNVKLTPKVTGRINFLQVHEGDRVAKGQVLVRLDPTEIQAQVEQKEAMISQKSAVIAQKNAAIANAKYKLAQAKLTKGPNDSAVNTQIAQQVAAVASAKADYAQVHENYNAQVAAAEAAVTDAKGRVENATATIANAKANINSAKANLDNATSKFNRLQELYKQGFIAAQDVDDAKATVTVQQANLEVAQGQLQSALAARDSALAQRQSAEQQATIVKTKGPADIEASRAKLVQAQEALKYAQVNKAQTPAFEQNLAALDAEVTAAKADLSSAQADLINAAADLRNMRAQLTNTVLTSPLDGFVTARYMDPGGLASPSTPVIEVQFIKTIWVTFTVPENVSAKLHFGQPVSVVLDPFPTRTFTANIVQMNASADTTSRQFTIRATIANPDNQLKPGMFAHISMDIERADGATVVPLEAIQADPDGRQFVLAIATEDGKMIVHKQPVTTGLSDAHFTAILAGLKPGDKVVTICALPLKEGMEVSLGGERKGHGKGDGAGAPGGGEKAGNGAAPAAGAHHGKHGQ